MSRGKAGDWSVNGNGISFTATGNKGQVMQQCLQQNFHFKGGIWQLLK